MANFESYRRLEGDTLRILVMSSFLYSLAVLTRLARLLLLLLHKELFTVELLLLEDRIVLGLERLVVLVDPRAHIQLRS